MLSNRFDRPLTAYLDYCVRRYYLSAIDSFNVISTIKRMVCAYIVTAYELERLENPTQAEAVKFCRDIQKRSNIPMKTANSSKMNLSSIHFFNRQFNRCFINKSRTHFTVFGICCLFFIFVRILFVSFFHGNNVKFKPECTAFAECTANAVSCFVAVKNTLDY